jgi:hypothetical protein
MKENKELKASSINEDERLAEYIVIVVGKYLNLDKNFCTTNNRRADLVYGRQMCMFFMRKYTKLRLHNIAKFFANKNHATVLHGIKHLESLRQFDKLVQKEILELDKIIRHKSKSNNKNVDFQKDFYFIDFNDAVSFRFSPIKGMLLTGFTDDEIEMFKKYLVGVIESREHQDTGMYILEQNNEPHGK